MRIATITIMKKDIPAESMDVENMDAESMDVESMDAADMMRSIPVAVVGTALHWKGKMQEEHAEYTTGAHLMMVLSLILLMIAENHWNLYVEPV